MYNGVEKQQHNNFFSNMWRSNSHVHVLCLCVCSKQGFPCVLGHNLKNSREILMKIEMKDKFVLLTSVCTASNLHRVVFAIGPNDGGSLCIGFVTDNYLFWRDCYGGKRK